VDPVTCILYNHRRLGVNEKKISVLEQLDGLIEIKNKNKNLNNGLTQLGNFVGRQGLDSNDK